MNRSKQAIITTTKQTVNKQSQANYNKINSNIVDTEREKKKTHIESNETKITHIKWNERWEKHWATAKEWKTQCKQIKSMANNELNSKK